MNLRHTPELSFVADHSVEYGSRMDALIRRVSEEDRSKPEGRPVNEQNRYDEDEES